MSRLKTEYDQGHVGDCSQLVEHAGTRVDRAGLVTIGAEQRFQTAQMATVTALNGFKRRLVVTIHERRERHRPRTLTHTRKQPRNEGASNDL